MSIECKQINLAINLCLGFGNEISEILEGWSKVKKAIYMRNELTQALKEKILLEAEKLKYWEYEGSPHNQPDKGFICNECEIAIVFPWHHNNIR
jgi:hypothetical protein